MFVGRVSGSNRAERIVVSLGVRVGRLETAILTGLRVVRVVFES